MSGASTGRASLLTPMGRGAVAVVAAEGEAAFAAIDASDYQGWVGAEYRPRTTTAESLGWLRPFL